MAFQKLRDRLDMLEAECYDSRERKAAKRSADYIPTDYYYSTESRDHFFFAICDYILRHDIYGFRNHLRESARNYKKLFENFNLGGVVDDSYVSMNSFQLVFQALAAGDFILAKEFVELMGGRDEIEKKHDHPFDRALGYALKACILDDKAGMEYWLPIAMQESGRDNKVKRLVGYAEGLVAIYNLDEKAFNDAMQKINKDHKKLSSSGGLFVCRPQEVINVWGVGLINLARYKGLDVTFNDDEYLPKELII